jgi:alkylhydroperoxidase family enzyme
MGEKGGGIGRIALLDLEESRKRAQDVGVPAQMADLNIFRTLLHSPKLAGSTCDLLLTLLFRAELDDRLRELVIMRLGWATGSAYEWTQHWRIALDQFGCTEEELLALRGEWRDSDLFDEAACAVLEATDETLETGTLSSATFARCREHVGGDRACLELVASIATWRWISQLARSLDIPLEEGVSSWPPDGRRPA